MTVEKISEKCTAHLQSQTYVQAVAKARSAAERIVRDKSGEAVDALESSLSKLHEEHGKDTCDELLPKGVSKASEIMKKWSASKSALAAATAAARKNKRNIEKYEKELHAARQSKGKLAAALETAKHKDVKTSKECSEALKATLPDVYVRLGHILSLAQALKGA
jgi:uncharacterized protein YeaO (DUF488 family)